MLRIWIKGFREDCIKNPNGYFDLYKKKEWLNNEYAKKYIKEIDDSVHVKDEYIESPVYGGISPRDLSSGCKCLIMLAVLDGCNVYASRMGDNCAKFILELAEERGNDNLTPCYGFTRRHEGYYDGYWSSCK